MDKERFALRLSVAGAVFMTFLGVGFALLTRSDAILLDGVFNLMTFVMSLLTLKVATLINRGESMKFQFGYYNFEPLLNMVKGLIILIICVFALVSSVEVILNGGKELQVGLAVVYAVVATISCFSVAFVLRYYKKQLHSPLIEVDAFNWMVNGVISGAVTLTFVIAFLMKETAWSHFVPYIDPALVCILVVSVLSLPIQTIREGINQLLGGSPDPELEKEVREKINELVDEYSFEQSQIRMMLTGRLFYVFIQILIPKTFTFTQVSDLDHIRERVNEAVKDIHSGLSIDVVFTGDSRWLK